MGEEITLTNLQVIQDGLLLMDFKNKQTNEGFRVFVEPQDFFGRLAKSMQGNHDIVMNRVFDEIKNR